MTAMRTANAALASERMRAHVNAMRAASADHLRDIGPGERGRKPQRRASAQRQRGAVGMKAKPRRPACPQLQHRRW